MVIVTFIDKINFLLYNIFKKNNKGMIFMILQGYGAARLMADFHSPKVQRKEDIVDRFARIKWKDASEEQRKNLNWIEDFQGNKTAHLPLTEEQKIQLNKNKQYHYRKMYEYLIKNYGWEYGERFYQEKGLNCSKIKFELCKTPLEKGQCNLLCHYYKKGCSLKEGLNIEN